ncbi:transmembrane protein [Achlya hypogyna]|uniref:Transmembrane protein n=1 Tax=Achlya hypogyna TaxID=1202772 RepID=A0A1V9ZB61_ACHHY|nr:transmembrane protein [Achlya hypogyna]
MSLGFFRPSSLLRDTAPKLSSTASDIILEDERYYARRVYFTATPAPTANVLDDGALLPGGPVALMSPAFVGLVLQNVGIGVMSGMLASVSGPLYRQYLGVAGYQAAMYDTVVNLAWYSKVPLAILSDCVPMFGARRKPYMLLGWAIAGLASLALSLHDFPDAQRRNATMPADASHDTTVCFLLTLVTSVGVVLAVVAVDGAMVHCAQREGMDVRGRAQSVLYCARSLARSLPAAFCGVFLNSAAYGGSFTFAAGPAVPYVVLTWVSCLGVVTTLLFVVEPEFPQSVTLAGYALSAWRLPQRLVVAQICVFRYATEASFRFGAPTDLAAQLAPAPSAATAFGAIASPLVYATPWAVWALWGVNWCWRAAFAAATVAWIAINAGATLLVLYGVTTSGATGLLGTLFEEAPLAVRALTASFSAVELADFGNEALVYCFVTTWANLGVATGTLLSYILAPDADWAMPARADERSKMVTAYVLGLVVKLAGLALLGLLPAQKHDVQVLKMLNRTHLVLGASFLGALVLVGVLLFVLSALPLFGSAGGLPYAGRTPAM